MKVIMLAAGKGTRCYPFTYMYPKLFQQVCGIPIIEYMFSWFHALPECERVYLVVNHASPVEKIEDYLANRQTRLADIEGLFKRLGYPVSYVNQGMETEIIEAFGHGTGGDLRFAVDTINGNGGLGEDVLICNADYVTLCRNHDGYLTPQLDLGDMFNYHHVTKKRLGTVMTVGLVAVPSCGSQSYGVAQVEKSKDAVILKSFVEKPEQQPEDGDVLINAGIYFVDGEFMNEGLDTYLPRAPQTSLEKTLIGKLASEQNGRLAAHVLPLYRWFDVGTLERVVDANICLIEEGAATRKTSI